LIGRREFIMEHEINTTDRQMLLKDILEECDHRLKAADFEINDLSPEGKKLLFSSVYKHVINNRK
jgi:molybdopterin/thiamine biosynthesis adenylyltransferase